MPSTGPNAPGTGANNAGAGNEAWANPTRIQTDDGDNSSTGNLTISETSQRLQATVFGFAIPAGATIDGIVVEVKRLYSTIGGSGVKDLEINLLKAGVITGDNKATATTWPTTAAYATYGSSTDLWGTTWSESEIEASDFGVNVRAQKVDTSGIDTAKAEFVRVTVYYTEAATAPFPPWRPNPMRSLLAQ